MNKLISKSQFKAKALEYFRQVEESGDSIVITDHGQPKLEVRPFRDQSPSPLSALRGSVLHYDAPFAPVDDDAWEAQQ